MDARPSSPPPHATIPRDRYLNEGPPSIKKQRAEARREWRRQNPVPRPPASERRDMHNL